MKYLQLILLVMVLSSCENRELNEGEKFRPRQLHDNFSNSHFTKVTVDGVEYLMLERDNNNPHEGFGFMAFRANNLVAKQDTTIAYLKAISEFQIKIMDQLSNKNEEEVQQEFNELLEVHLKEEAGELEKLQSDSLSAVEEK